MGVGGGQASEFRASGLESWKVWGAQDSKPFALHPFRVEGPEFSVVAFLILHNW